MTTTTTQRNPNVHPIEPVPVYSAGTTDPEWACDACGEKLYPVKGGWRHDPAGLRERPATWPGRAS